MINITTKDYTGQNWERVNKTTARKAYQNGKEIYLVPSNLFPFGGWGFGSEITAERMEEKAFNDVVREYEFYNCTNETGNFASYYVKICTKRN